MTPLSIHIPTNSHSDQSLPATTPPTRKLFHWNPDGSYNYRNATGFTQTNSAGVTVPSDLTDNRAYTDIGFQERVGLPHQDMLTNIPHVETVLDTGIDGTEIRDANTVSFHVSDRNFDKVRIILSFPRMTKMDKKTGDLFGTTVSYSISVSVDGNTSAGNKTDFTLTGKCTSTYQRSLS